MKIVIDISEELYKNVIEHIKMGYIGSDVWIAVANGTPLPKGHGDLIDRDALKQHSCGGDYDGCGGFTQEYIPISDVDSAPAVILADTSEVD